VTRDGEKKLEKDYLVDEGNSGLTASADDYQKVYDKGNRES